MKTEGDTRHGIVANLLLRAGIVDAASLTRAVETQAGKGGTLAKVLSSLDLADEETACAAIADGLRLSYVGPDVVTQIGDDVTSLLPADFIRERLVLPLGVAGAAVQLAISKPLHSRTPPEVQF